MEVLNNRSQLSRVGSNLVERKWLFLKDRLLDNLGERAVPKVLEDKI